MRSLALSIADAVAAGDLAAARIAHEALGKLLTAEPAGEGAAEVVDLGLHRGVGGPGSRKGDEP